MADTYTLTLMDEYDWEYSERSKDAFKSIVVSCGYSVKASTDYFMIVYCGRTNPVTACKTLRDAMFVYDMAYSMRNNDMALIPVSLY